MLPEEKNPILNNEIMEIAVILSFDPIQQTNKSLQIVIATNFRKINLKTEIIFGQPKLGGHAALTITAERFQTLQSKLSPAESRVAGPHTVYNDPVYMSRKIRKVRTDKFDT